VGFKVKTGDEVLDTLMDYDSKIRRADDYTFTLDRCSVRVFALECLPNSDWSGVVLLVAENNLIYKDRLLFVRARERKAFCSAARAALGMPLPTMDDFLMELDRALRRRSLYTASGLRVYSLADSLEAALPEQHIVIESIAATSELTLLVGEGGTGKTARALVMGLCAASGAPFLGLSVPEPVKVLYMNLEMSEYEFRHRINILSKHFLKVARYNFLATLTKYFDISSPADQRALEEQLDGIRLLIVDNHSWWHGALDENDNTEMMEGVVIPILAMAARRDCAVVLLHHTPWTGQRPRGAVGLYNAASICLLLEPDKEHEYQAILTFKKWRTAAQVKPKPIITVYDPDTYLVDRIGTDIKDLEFPVDHTEAIKQLMVKMGISYDAARKRIWRLIDNGRLGETAEGMLYLKWQTK